MENNSSQGNESVEGRNSPHEQQEVTQSSREGAGGPLPQGNMFEAFAHYLGTIVETAMRAVERERGGAIHAQFMKYQPPRFSGMGASTEAEDWLGRIEDIFELMEVTGEQRVRLAAFQFMEQAALWWKATKSLFSNPTVGMEQSVEISWERFKESFNEKYFPEAYRLEQRREFINLKQEKGMTIQEYEVKFTSLSRFASRLIDDEYEKCRKFQEGLLPSIREKLAWKETMAFRDSQKRSREEEKGEARECQNQEARKGGRREWEFPTTRSRRKILRKEGERKWVHRRRGDHQGK